MISQPPGANPSTFGASPGDDGVFFRVWAPAHQQVEVVIETSDGRTIAQPMARSEEGIFSAHVRSVRPGDRYRYRTDLGLFPDPASRFQPEGVHGPSEIVDPAGSIIPLEGWRGRPLEDFVLYELHVGTFTPEGTFDAARLRLPDLRDLGVTAIELMPVADFTGERNWGYDGVSLFAPARCYGRPEDLRRLIDTAHRLGLAVILDVVYNHLGPEGNYLGVYGPHFTTKRPDTAWGAAHNFDGEHSEHVREFFIQNAIHWVRDYGFDGLRLDATHVIFDDGPRHVLAELTERVKAAAPDRHVVLIAEDHRNLNHMLTPPAGGWGLDGVWADGFHHHTRRLLAGDHEGYFQDFSGTTQDLVATMQKGWFYCGEHSKFYDEPLGTDPSSLAYPQFVYCLQNHDQVGNRAFGDRLHHQVDLAAYRAASAMLLLGPWTPLLFMGQEWAATSPFRYFTHHSPDLGKLVTEGRRKEFAYFSAFADPAVRETIPDPQAAATFVSSKLVWSERDTEPHASMLRLYRALLEMRRREPALRSTARKDFRAQAVDDGTLWFERRHGNRVLVALVRLKGSGPVRLPDHSHRTWDVWMTEDFPFTPMPRRPNLHTDGGVLVVDFPGPAAVILRGEAE